MKFNQVAKDYSAGWKMRVNTFAAVESRCTEETYSGWSRSASFYLPRLASSASSARSFRTAKNAGDWPMKSPMSVRNFTTPFAMPFVPVGRIIEHGGSFRLRNGHGSGMIRLV